MTYDETVEKLKNEVLTASLSEGKLVNPLNSENRKLTSIMCTWNQMFKAMALAEKEWNDMKSKDNIFLKNRHDQIKGELVHRRNPGNI
jgi:hypothetical protein